MLSILASGFPLKSGRKCCPFWGLSFFSRVLGNAVRFWLNNRSGTFLREREEMLSTLIWTDFFYEWKKRCPPFGLSFLFRSFFQGDEETLANFVAELLLKNRRKCHPFFGFIFFCSSDGEKIRVPFLAIHFWLTSLPKKGGNPFHILPELLARLTKTQIEPSH